MSNKTGDETGPNKKPKLADDDKEIKELMLGKAVSCGFLEKVQSLVEEGKVDVASAVYKGAPILTHCEDDLTMVQYLIDKGALVDPTIIRQCFGNAKTVAESDIPKRKLQIYLQAKPELFESAWSNAIMYRSKEIAEFLLQSFNSSADSLQLKLFQLSSTCTSSYNNGNFDVEILKLLIQHGASVNATNEQSQTPLLLALKNMPHNQGQKVLGKIKFLIDGYTATMDGALHLATKRENVGVVKLLIDRGVDVNATDAAGQTPLHLVRGNLDLALLLVHMGADIHKTCHNGSIAMASICSAGQDGEDLHQTMILAEMNRNIKAGLEKLSNLG